MDLDAYKITFRDKKKEALIAIATNEEVYIDEARMAAIEVLEENGTGLSESLKHLKDEILTSFREKEQILKAKLVEVEGGEFVSENKADESLPQLYSKRLILVFSILFSTIFGAVLLMLNMRSVQSKKGQQQVLFFAILFMILSMTIAQFLMAQSNIALVLNIIGGFVLTEYFWNKYIGAEKRYEKKGWIKPTLISLAIILPLVLAVLYGMEMPA